MNEKHASAAIAIAPHTKLRLPSIRIFSVVCALLLTLCSSVLTAYADGQPGGNITDPVVRAVDIAKPSVVRIITAVASRLTVHFAPGNDVVFPQNTSNGNSYLIRISGSGTFITSKGDILTADHVVNPAQGQGLQDALYMRAAEDVANYMNRNVKAGSAQVTATQVAEALASAQLQSTTNFDKPISEVFLSTDYTGPLDATNIGNIAANLHASVDSIKQESAVDQKDVAIIHAAFTFDTPSVQLGDSSMVQQQDVLTIIGFPGNGDVSHKPTDLLTSSVNKIIVSSIKTTDNGAPVIQVGGNVEHGDSGGPALDSKGNVVGIVSFGLVSPGSTGGTSFLQASNSARELVQSLALNTTPGNFQQLWSNAFTDYAANTPNHWYKARQEFQQLATNYPSFKAITPYLNYTTTQAQTETTTQSGSTTDKPGQPFSILGLTLMIASLALLALLTVFLFGVALRLRKKKAQTVPFNGQPDSTPATHTRAGALVPQTPLTLTQEDGDMAAFGAPPPGSTMPQGLLPPSTPPVNIPSTTQQGTVIPFTRPAAIPSSTLTSYVCWRCGHLNQPDTRFCGICGEPAPQPPQRRQVEQ